MSLSKIQTKSNKAPLPHFPKVMAFQKQIQLPMIMLSFGWFCVLIANVIWVDNRFLFIFGNVLWVLFLMYFIMRLAIAENRKLFLKKNWLFLLAIGVSILRFFPLFQNFAMIRALTATFGIQVIWIFASADQSMRQARRAMGHRGVGYAVALTGVVIFGGAAGILHFESTAPEADHIDSYLRALWWTGMQMTNIGSSYSLKSDGGKIVCLIISIYAAAMFGYLTALFASFIIDHDIKDPKIDLQRMKLLEEIHVQVGRLQSLIDSPANTGVPKMPAGEILPVKKSQIKAGDAPSPN